MTVCLPLAALWWYPDEHGDGPRRIAAPQGLPIHATMAGRVTMVDSQAVGAVVIRDEDERFHHYRRLQSSSITVEEHDVVHSGQILGVVAPSSDDTTEVVFYGVQRADETWIDVVELLLGATDPVELGLRIGIEPRARDAGSAPIRTRASPDSAFEPAAPSAPAGVPASVRSPDRTEPSVEPAPRDDEVSDDTPATDTENGAPKPKRSPLAARRPKRGPS